MNKTSHLLLAVCALLAASPLQAQDASTPKPSKEAETLMRAVHARMQNGDLSALNDLEVLPVEQLLLRLNTYLTQAQQGDGLPGQKEAVVKIMVKHHLEPIFEKDLASAADEHSVGVVYDLHDLALFKTKEAVRIIAKYLFDERHAIIHSDDVQYTPYRYAAAEALSAMELDDAPTKNTGLMAGNEELQLWRNWWKANHARYEQGR